ncbi:Putative ferrisiderophore receptor [gamma proteobacterium HdN1]|nr:Putative ferrisiderophore receptor [gamma proteobacterium HdN1]
MTVLPRPRTQRVLRYTPLFFCIAGISHAADNTNSDPSASDTTVLPALQITAEQARATEPVGYDTPYSSAATRTETPLEELPQSISVLSAQQIEDQKAMTLQDTLGYSAGVRAGTYGVDNRGDWFTLRGSSESNVLLDGMRQPTSGWYGSVRSEPFAYEQIEVLRGPSSVMAGQNAPGGVVNLVSKLPREQPSTELSLEAGNHDHKQLSLDSTGPLNQDNTLLYRIVALGKDSGTQIRHASEERSYFAPSLTWRPSSRTELTAYAQYQEDESNNTNAFLPWAGTLYPNPQYLAAGRPGYAPSHLFIGEPAWDTYGGTRHRAGYQIEQGLGERLTLRHSLRYDKIKGHLESMYANFWEVAADGSCATCPSPTQITRTAYGSRTDSEITTSDLVLEAKLHAGAIEHTLLVGADGMKMDDDQRTDTIDEATPLDVFNPVYGTMPRPDFDFSGSDPVETQQFGVFIQDQAKIVEKLVITGSLRRDHVDIDPANVDDWQTSHRMGITWLADNGAAPYLSYSESFETVSGKDSHGKVFVPKRGKQWESGIKFRPNGDNLLLSASVYLLKDENRPVADPNDPDPSDSFGEIQAGEVTVKGVELEASGKVENWDMIANYTRTQAQITEPASHAQLSSIPKNSASLWAVNHFSLAGISGFRAGGGVRYSGETGDGDDRIMTPSFAVFDALIALDQGSWRYALNINNLFDEEYIVTALERGDSWFGARRKIIGSLSYRL